MSDLLPKLAVVPAEPRPGAASSLDLAALFAGAAASPMRATRLEIGFGAGEHLAARARARPDVGFIGCEPFINGVASLLGAIDDAQGALDNIRIHHGDAREVVDALPDAALAGVDIHYPDPWPKARHHKRRFVNRDTLDALARVMKAGADLRVSTDIMDYARWTIVCALRHPAFRWTADRAGDWRAPPPGWPGTRYEAKALAAGRRPVYLHFVRIEADGPTA